MSGATKRWLAIGALFVSVWWLMGCVTMPVDYETCDTPNCAAPVDIEVK